MILFLRDFGFLVMLSFGSRRCLLSCLLFTISPSSYQLFTESNPYWQQAISTKMQALEKNCTWNLVDLLPGKSIVGSRPTRSRLRPMVQLSTTELVLWLGVSPRSMKLAIKKPLP